MAIRSARRSRAQSRLYHPARAWAMGGDARCIRALGPVRRGSDPLGPEVGEVPA
jgi:hypothetical protein